MTDNDRRFHDSQEAGARQDEREARRRFETFDPPAPVVASRDVVLRTFFDFSATKRAPWRWRIQAILHRDVHVFWDDAAFDWSGAWCRRIDNVRCTELADCYSPLPGQLVEYVQWKRAA